MAKAFAVADTEAPVFTNPATNVHYAATERQVTFDPGREWIDASRPGGELPSGTAPEPPLFYSALFRRAAGGRTPAS